MAAPLLVSPQRVPMPWSEYTALDADVPGEYYDGCLVMAPSPDRQHQQVSRRLADLLESAVSDSCEVNTAWQWSPAQGQNFIPDVMVYASTSESTRLTSTPVLAVEILSQNRRDDLVVKTTRYAAGGLQHYWVIDRDARRLRVYELGGSVYERTQVVGEKPAEVSIGICTVGVDLTGLLR